MITRPFAQRKQAPTSFGPRPQPAVRGKVTRFRPPAPVMPLDPSQGPQKPVTAQPFTGVIGPAFPSSAQVASQIPFGRY